jgi:hypothetical protein
MEHPKIGAPRADILTILSCEDPGDLVEMGKVVSYPGGEQLRKGDRAERRMKSAELKISRGEVELLKLDEISGAQAGEIVEQLREGFSLALALLA